ncbi:MAG: hypothetical protein ACK5MT_14960 [Actinomycetales bacterium]
MDLEKTQQMTTQAEVVAPTYVMPRVNLMPPEIAQEARFRRTRGMLIGATGLVLLGCLGGWALASHSVTTAERELAAEQATATALADEEAEFAEVPKVLSQIEATKNARAQGMAADIVWYTQLNDIAVEYPEGFVFDRLAMTLVADTADGTNPLAEPSIGTIDVEGRARNHLNPGSGYVTTARWLEAMSAHPGFVNPYYSEADALSDTQLDENVVKVTSSVDFTNDILSHRFDRKAQ